VKNGNGKIVKEASGLLKPGKNPTFRTVPFMTSERGNNMPFQRHRCPDPDFWSEKGKNAVSILN
jgi:hypothetical protein